MGKLGLYEASWVHPRQLLVHLGARIQDAGRILKQHVIYK